jgi:ParB family transcriptional regulator, chromosome partitioning protein
VAARRKRPKNATAQSVGLAAGELAGGEPPASVLALETKIREAGGATLARYRDPLGGHWLALAALPLATIAPTPFQRDLSEPHAKRLAGVIEKLDLFLDPVIAVPVPDDAAASQGDVRFWSPNGLHRLAALRMLGARSATALISPDPALAFRILALNTEKAHSVRERALEAVRMARGLSELDPRRPENAYAVELEDGSLVTLGLCYEERPRFAGGAYAPALRASDAFLDEALPKALARRSARAARLLAIDARVTELVAALRERGFESPYLRNFVVSRIRPFRPPGKPAPEADALLAAMETGAAKFNAGKVKEGQVARAAGAGGEE